MRQEYPVFRTPQPRIQGDLMQAAPVQGGLQQGLWLRAFRAVSLLARVARWCGLPVFGWLAAGRGETRLARASAPARACVFGLVAVLGLVLCGVGAGLPAPACAQDGLLLRQWVTDPQNVLSPEDNAALSHKLYDLSQTLPGHPQIVVALPGHVEDISQYANEAFHKTGIGRKDVDNGLLVVLDIPDCQSRIEVGYGLEGVLTDLQSNDILQAARPALQAGQYAQAVNGIVDAIASVLSHADPADLQGGAAAPASQPDSQTDALEALAGLVVVGILFILLPIWLIRRSRRRAALYPGGYVPPEIQAERSARWSFFLNLILNILSMLLQGGGRGGGGGSSSGGSSGGFRGGGGDSGGGGSQSSW